MEALDVPLVGARVVMEVRAVDQEVRGRRRAVGAGLDLGLEP